MRILCSFIGCLAGWVLGMLIEDYSPFLTCIFIIGGTPLGIYIGELIGKKQKEEQEIDTLLQEAEEADKKREQGRKRQKAISLCNKYPEAAKYYFKFHFGIEMDRIPDYYVTDNRVGLLLAHSEADYKKMDELERVNAVARKKEQEELARQKKEKREKALYLCSKYPRAAQFYFKNFLGQKNIFDITDGDVVFLLLRSESEYQKQEEEEKAKEEANKKEQEEARRKEEERKRKEEELARQKEERRNRAASLCEKYPLSAKYFLRKSFRIRNISKITDKEVDILLSKPESEYIKQEESEKEKIEARRREQEEARRKEEERKRIEEELARQREEEAKRQLESSLRACVSSWDAHSYSSLKHKYFYDYFPYRDWKDKATPDMWDAWHTVWHFKNDPAKNISPSEHNRVLNVVVDLVEKTLRETFGSKTQYLTLVCLTASTQRKTEMRYKEFAERVCKDLKMTNAYPYIRVIEEGEAKHDGGDGSHSVTYDDDFFKGKYVVLFDDVRTSGYSLDEELRRMEIMGATVICAITIAQTK